MIGKGCYDCSRKPSTSLDIQDNRLGIGMGWGGSVTAPKWGISAMQSGCEVSTRKGTGSSQAATRPNGDRTLCIHVPVQVNASICQLRNPREQSPLLGTPREQDAVRADNAETQRHIGLTVRSNKAGVGVRYILESSRCSLVIPAIFKLFHLRTCQPGG